MDEVNFFGQLDRLDDLVTAFTVDNAPNLEIFFDADCKENLSLWQVLYEFDTLSMYCEAAEDFSHLHHMEQDDAAFAQP